MARPDNVDTLRIRAALDSGLLQRHSATPVDFPELDLGESEAIALALEIGAAVLLDDGAARARAKALGLVVTGTLGVLVRARRRDRVGPLLPLIATLRTGGQRLGRLAVSQALQAVGEEPE